jgi:hypothetical protein
MTRRINNLFVLCEDTRRKQVKKPDLRDLPASGAVSGKFASLFAGKLSQPPRIPTPQKATLGKRENPTFHKRENLFNGSNAPDREKRRHEPLAQILRLLRE